MEMRKGAIIVGDTSETYIDNDFVIKKQVRYTEYSLIHNQYEKLQYVRMCPHVPQILWKEDNNTLRMDYCGATVTEKNLPFDVMRQLEEIRIFLYRAGVVHRNIKPEHFLVKEGWLYLIGWSWAVFEGQILFGDETIGYPYKPIKGWDDAYSLELVAKYYKQWLKN